MGDGLPFALALVKMFHLESCVREQAPPAWVHQFDELRSVSPVVFCDWLEGVSVTVAAWTPEHVWDQDCCSPSGSRFTDLTLAIRASSPKRAAAAQMNYLDLLLSYHV